MLRLLRWLLEDAPALWQSRPQMAMRRRHVCVEEIYCVLRMKAHLISCDPVVRISLTMALITICWLAWRNPSSK
jgi:hypothetical protein